MQQHRAHSRLELCFVYGVKQCSIGHKWLSVLSACFSIGTATLQHFLFPPVLTEDMGEIVLAALFITTY